MSVSLDFCYTCNKPFPFGSSHACVFIGTLSGQQAKKWSPSPDLIATMAAQIAGGMGNVYGHYLNKKDGVKYCAQHSLDLTREICRLINESNPT